MWLGLVWAYAAGNFTTAIESTLFALGTGFLLVVMNLVRAILHLRVSVLTTGLGALLIIIYSPLYFLNVGIPFLPALVIIAGIALIIGTIRTRRYYLA